MLTARGADAGQPLLLAFASVSERNACAGSKLLGRLSKLGCAPVRPVITGLAARQWPGSTGPSTPCGLLSAGVAGGLVPQARTGTVLLPRVVIGSGGRRREVDVLWHARVLEALPPDLTVLTAPLVGNGPLLATAAAKQALGQQTGATGVDMESAQLCEWAAQAGVPFLVLRVVLDTVKEDLPPWSASALQPDGRTAYGALLAQLLARPRGFVELARTARAFHGATRRWRQAALAAAPALLSPGRACRPGPHELLD
ncbi:MAG: hypothetical protein JJT85_04955 [Chromatiales bacterium]|nr:hypothetical protein [Chromatiales bacterium]